MIPIENLTDVTLAIEDTDEDDEADEDDEDGFPANSHHDKIPPWWEYVINRGGGFLSPAY